MTDRCPFPSCRPKRPRCCARTSLPRRRFNESKLVRWERRNADYTRVKSFEYKVHVTVHENENDIEGEKTIVWAPLEILTGITGFAGVGLIALGAKVAVAPDAQIRDDGDDVVLPSEAARDAVDE